MKAGLFSVQAGLDEGKSGAVRVDELPNLQNENVFCDYIQMCNNYIIMNLHFRHNLLYLVSL